MALILLLLLLVDNLYFNYSGIKIRISELLGIAIYGKLIYRKWVFHGEIKYPPATGYFMLFMVASSVSMIGISQIPFNEGIKFQLHILILFITGVALFNRLLVIKEEKIEKVVFAVSDILLLYAGVQIIIYYILGHALTFGMERWSDPNLFISYRQDIVIPEATTDISKSSPWLRPPSVFGEPVFFGFFCAWLIIIYSIKYQLSPPKDRLKWLLRFSISAVIGIFIASRALWISTVIVILFYVFNRGHKKFIKELVAILGSVAIILFILGSFADIDFIAGIYKGRFNIDFIQSDIRTYFWGFQLSGFINSPWIGHGRGMTHDLVITLLPESFDEVAQAVGGYSFWISLLYDTGILGLITFLIFLIKTFRNRFRFASVEKPIMNPYSYGLVGLLIFGLLLGPMLSCGTFWFAMVMLWVFNHYTIHPQNHYITPENE